MRYWKYIIWLLILLSCKASAPITDYYSTDRNFKIYLDEYVPYKIKWSCVNERFVSNYKAQRSKNGSNWLTQSTYLPKNLPDSSVYSWQLPKSAIPYFYRIVAKMNNSTYYSKILYLKSTYP